MQIAYEHYLVHQSLSGYVMNIILFIKFDSILIMYELDN